MGARIKFLSVLYPGVYMQLHIYTVHVYVGSHAMHFTVCFERCLTNYHILYDTADVCTYVCVRRYLNVCTFMYMHAYACRCIRDVDLTM